MDEARRNDDALFEALNKAKRRKRRRRWITVLIILALVAGGILYAVNVLRKRVEASMATESDEVLTYDASIGSISTRVSGSGTIENVDTEKVTVPEGVEIDEVMVKSNDKLRKGDLIATLDLTSVLSTLASVQEELDELDKELAAAGGDRVNTNVTAGVSGRVKKIYAGPKTDVAACMVENGALALISEEDLCRAENGCGGLHGGKRRPGPDLSGREDGGRVRRQRSRRRGQGARGARKRQRD